MPTVFIPAQLRSLTGGTTQLEGDASSVRQVVEALEERFPGVRQRLCEGEELASSLQVSIDGVMTSQGMRAKTGPESEVHFLPIFGGG